MSIRELVRQAAKQNLRIDSRSFHEERPVDKQFKDDNTYIIDGINTCIVFYFGLELFKMDTNTGSEGKLNLSVLSNFSCLARSSCGELAKSSSNISELIRRIKLVDLKRLCVLRGFLGYTLNISIIPLVVDGGFGNYCFQGLIDVINKGIPKLSQRVFTEYPAVWRKCRDVKLTKFIRVDKNWMRDPVEHEEGVADCTIDIANSNITEYIQVRGEYGFTLEEVSNVIDILLTN